MMTISLPFLIINKIFFSSTKVLLRNINFLHHIFSPVFLTLIGVFIRVRGKEKLNRGESFIIIGNHRSALDFILNAVAFPGVYQYLAKKELTRVPVFGWVVKNMCVIVDRESAGSRARSVVAIRQQLNKGMSIFIYPEGSRNTGSNTLGDFHDGAFRIAVETGVPIAIQTILNVGKISHSAGIGSLQPGVVDILWETPIQTSGLTTEDIPTLKNYAKEMMHQRLMEYENI
jgi:1-acyl-sn-glycerol-3-phosphate acyltransferase